jgi:hypothetical protein
MLKRTLCFSSLFFLAAACDDEPTGGPGPGPTPPPTSAGISVSNPAVRGCDVLLVDAGGQFTAVTWSDTVQGEHQRWAPRTALSFVVRQDAAPSGSLATLSVAGSGLTLSSAECYDRLGAPVASPGVALQ